MPGDAAPVVKIGVIAPFEGAGRPLGYAVLPAIKAAVAEANASGDTGPLPGAGGGVQRRSVWAHRGRAGEGVGAGSGGAGGRGAVDGGDSPRPRRRSWPRRACRCSTAADMPIPPPGEKWGDAALADAATLAGEDARVLLDALAADIRAHGQPTRRCGGCVEQP